MKTFTSDVIEWWIKWSRIHRKSKIKTDEAEKELEVLKALVTSLKNYHR